MSIINDKNAVLIGGAVVDILGVPEFMIGENCKNHGKVSITPGGVSFNIASNLAKLGISTSLISVFCDDDLSQILRNECIKNSIDISNSRYIDGCSSPKYLCALDENGEIKAAISDTKIFAQISLSFIKEKIDYINSFDVCLIDGNVSEEVFEYLLQNVKTPVYVDPVSVDHSKKLTKHIGRANAVKPNILEAQVLSGMKINNTDDLKEAYNYFLEIGLEEVFISLGENGLCYGANNCFGIIKHTPTHIVNTNGAGDSMMAGLLYGKLMGYTIKEKAKLSVAVANITLQSEATINNELNIEILKRNLEYIK